MGFVGTAELLDFVSSLAVLGLLVVGFSALGPNLKNNRLSPLLQGTIFGLVVMLQMSMPLSPTEGVIVDMRNVPIVLAGAFLGLRGLAVCLCLAVATRVGLGGVGSLAGVVGMLIAGGVGYGWSLLEGHVTRPTWLKLAALGGAVNLHMLSALLVSPDIMWWYFREAAPTVLILNLISVPVIGSLLRREANLVTTHARLVASAHVDPTTRLLTPDAFACEVGHFNASGTGSHIAGVLAVTVKNARWLTQTWGDSAVDQALGALRVRVAGICADSRPLGIDASRRLLLPISQAEMQDLRPLRKTLRRLAFDTPFLLDDDVEAPLSIISESYSLRHADKPAVTVQDVRRAATARRLAPEQKATRPIRSGPEDEAALPAGMTNDTLGRLFDRAEVKLGNAA